MTPTTTHTCVMTFNTSLYGKRNVRIPDPRPGLSVSAVTTAAGSFLSISPFDETIGTLTSLARAELVSETHTILI